MLYTLGNKKVYDKYIEMDSEAAKAVGGSVWKTKKDIEKYLEKFPNPGFDVYGVKANWERDTKFDSIHGTSVNWNELTKKAKLIKLRSNK